MTYLNPPDLGGLSRPTGIPTGKKLKRENLSMFRLVALFFVLIVIHSCGATEPGNNEKLYIELADVSCTESWLKVETSGVNLPAELKLYRDNELAREIIVNEKSTIIYDSLLLPSQSYKYQVKLPGITSREITVTTLDTTSHDFKWQTYTFGEHASSVLYDAAIIDENNIWAVGEIYLNDSTGRPNPHAYNAVHWDGGEWTLHRIMFYTICGQQSRTSYPARAITAFSENEIWVAGGGRQLAKISGTIQLEPICPPFSIFINKIWGTSSENLYVVGDNGNIARYDGSSWHRIGSGTIANITDVYGIHNNGDGYNKYCSADNALLKIDGNNRLSRINAEPDMFIISVWGISNSMIYTAGSGVVLYKNYKWEKIDNPHMNTIYRIKGQNHNDIAALSSTKAIFHFNGYSWKSIQAEANNIFLKIEIKGDLIAAVGWENNQAVITLLKRNN